MASPGNRHCANCIGALSIPVTATYYSSTKQHHVRVHADVGKRAVWCDEITGENVELIDFESLLHLRLAVLANHHGSTHLTRRIRPTSLQHCDKPLQTISFTHKHKWILFVKYNVNGKIYIIKETIPVTHHSLNNKSQTPHPHTHTHKHTHTQTQTQTHTYTNTNTNTQTHMHARTRARARI